MPTNKEYLFNLEMHLGEHIRIHNIQDEGPTSKEEDLKIMKKMYIQDMKAKDERNAAVEKELKDTKGYLRVVRKMNYELIK